MEVILRSFFEIEIDIILPIFSGKEFDSIKWHKQMSFGQRSGGGGVNIIKARYWT